MAEHTPGPWTFNGTTVRTPHGKLRVRGIEEAIYSGDMEEATANARLIAASPTMFDYITARAKEGDQRAAKIIAAIKNRSDA